MPCLTRRALASFASRAAISASMSERTEAMADCSRSGGRPTVKARNAGFDIFFMLPLVPVAIPRSFSRNVWVEST